MHLWLGAPDLCSKGNNYRKIPKISPSMYKPLQKKAPQTGNAKNPPLNRPSQYKPRGACTWKIALKYKVKQCKNGKFTLNYKVSPIDFKRKFPSLDKPLRLQYKPLQK